VRAWLEANVPPGITRVPASPDDSLQRYRELRTLGRALGDKGWLYARAPARTAAAGSTSITPSSWRRRPIASALALPPYYDSGGKLGSATILVWGTEAQKRAFLPPIYRRRVRTCTPDRAGAARPGGRDDGGHPRRRDYVITGQKIGGRKARFCASVPTRGSSPSPASRRCRSTEAARGRRDRLLLQVMV